MLSSNLRRFLSTSYIVLDRNLKKKIKKKNNHDTSTVCIHNIHTSNARKSSHIASIWIVFDRNEKIFAKKMNGNQRYQKIKSRCLIQKTADQRPSSERTDRTLQSMPMMCVETFC